MIVVGAIAACLFGVAVVLGAALGVAGINFAIIIVEGHQ